MLTRTGGIEVGERAGGAYSRDGPPRCEEACVCGVDRGKVLKGVVEVVRSQYCVCSAHVCILSRRERDSAARQKHGLCVTYLFQCELSESIYTLHAACSLLFVFGVKVTPYCIQYCIRGFR